MEDKKISSKAIPCRMIRYAVIAAIAIAVTVALALTVKNTLLTVLLAVADVLMIAAGAILPPFQTRAWSYTVREDRICTRHGVFFKNYSVVPVLRVQHIEISAGPIQRAFGLSTLTVYTAGSSVSIPMLEREEAEKTSEHIKKLLEERIKKDETDERGIFDE